MSKCSYRLWFGWENSNRMGEAGCQSRLPGEIFLSWLAEVNEAAWRSKPATKKNIPAKDGLNSGNSRLKKKKKEYGDKPPQGETEGNVEKQAGVSESMGELLKSPPLFTDSHKKTQTQAGVKSQMLCPPRHALPRLSPSQGHAPRAAPAGTFLFVIYSLTNKGTGLRCCFACESKRACSQFERRVSVWPWESKLCSAS